MNVSRSRIKNSQRNKYYFFVHPHNIPHAQKVTYIKLVASLWSFKTNIHLVLVTMGGGKLEYNNNISYYPTILTTVKIHVNSTISTDRSRYITLCIKVSNKELQWDDISTHTCNSN